MHAICPNSVRSLAVLLIFASALSADQPAPKIRFNKQVLTGEYYCDGVDAGDINSDGHVDVVAGPFWYAGPDFQTAHEIYPPQATPRAASPSDSMFSFVHDFDHDGNLDVLVLGRVHKHAAYWYQNPGHTEAPDGSAATKRHWQKHFVFERIRGESPELCDLDNDGVPQLICHWQGRWGYVEPKAQAPTEPWHFHPDRTAARLATVLPWHRHWRHQRRRTR